MVIDMATGTAKKRKFNAVDAVIIIVILAVIAAAAALLMVNRSGENQTEETTVEYIVEFRQIREEFGDNFKVGAMISDSVAKYQLGDVTAVNVENSKYNGNNLLTGELVVSDYPERIDVQLTVRSDAKIGEDGMFYIGGGYRLSVGSAVYVRMPDFVGMGYCIDIKETEA